MEATAEITITIVKWTMIRIAIDKKDIEDWAGKITIKTKRPAQLRNQILEDYERVNTWIAENYDKIKKSE